MTMNPEALIDPDILLIFAAIASSFLLGCVHRLVRALGQQQREVAHTGADVRELLERCDAQQARVKRMQDEMENLRGRLPRRSKQPTRRSARDATGARPARADTRVDPLKLARTGAGVETLMSRCRLSRAEAELVLSVHGTHASQAA